MNSPDAASVGRGYLAKVRSAIHRFPKLPKAAQLAAAKSIKGRIVYVRRTNPSAAARLAKQLEAGWKRPTDLQVINSPTVSAPIELGCA